MKNIIFDQVRGALLGCATGDAFGVPFEFLAADKVSQYPQDRMLGADVEPRMSSHWGDQIPAGSWSDDTSMALATMDSLVKTGGKLDPDDLMGRFLNWMEHDEYCALDKNFDIGITVEPALENYRRGASALTSGGTDKYDNGNGSLMRIFPIALLNHAQKPEPQVAAQRIFNASSLTHGHKIAQLSCLIYCHFLEALLDGESLADAFEHIQYFPYTEHYKLDDYAWEDAFAALLPVFSPEFSYYTPEDFTATGYVVDTLAIVFYSLLNSRSYEETIQCAVSFGYDTDTYAAIAGAAAGIYYGVQEIPEAWLTALRKRDYLEDVATQFTRMLSA
ncbi:ADP-ribosylglycohydrolase family protein [Arcanobacterium phocae]|uniref:ADP-ribosylglycohydrolase family protein n=1 Tax=Arcanobacterium phocae TaxID=131112 RepID=UPI001C116AF3|nr:ADP-ribosylglycohydrolase family protein [Arcanobacterium phocae]